MDYKKLPKKLVGFKTLNLMRNNPGYSVVPNDEAAQEVGDGKPIAYDNRYQYVVSHDTLEYDEILKAMTNHPDYQEALVEAVVSLSTNKKGK